MVVPWFDTKAKNIIEKQVFDSDGVATMDAWITYIKESEAKAGKPVPEDSACREAATYFMEGLNYGTPAEASGALAGHIHITGHTTCGERYRQQRAQGRLHENI